MKPISLTSRTLVFAAAAIAFLGCSDAHDLMSPTPSMKPPVVRQNSQSTTTDPSGALQVLVSGPDALSSNTQFHLSVGLTLPSALAAAPLDVIVVLDGSGSVGRTSFQTALDAINGLIQTVPWSASGNHIGIEEFGTTAKTVYTLAQEQSILDTAFDRSEHPTALDSATMKMTFFNNDTYTITALDTAVAQFAASGRSSSRKVILLVTNGPANPPSQNPCSGIASTAPALLNALAANSIETYTLGVGSYTDASQFACLTGGDLSRFIGLTGYTDVQAALTNTVTALTNLGDVTYTATLPTTPSGVRFINAAVIAPNGNPVFGNTNVTNRVITWNAKAGDSGLQITYDTQTLPSSLCGPVTLLTNQTAVYNGNTTVIPDYTINAPPCDVTPPVITPTIAGPTNASGWYTGDVTVHWNVSDPESSVSSSAGCADVTINADTKGTTVICSATSGGGTSADTIAIKRDATIPALTPTLTGTLGANGWYTSNVSVAWGTSAPGISGLTTTCPSPISIASDTPGQTVTCTATTGAGVSTTATVTVKRDASTPVVSAVPQGPLNLVTGWYTGDASIAWTATAAGPSGATATCNVVSITADTPGQTYTCTATSGAGLTGTGSILVKRDATIPLITGTASGTTGSNGWFTSDVGIHFAVSAAGLSGMTANCPDATLTTDAESRSYTCTATTGAGIITKNTVTVKRDASSPVVGAVPAGPMGINGWYTGDVTVAWTAAGSGPSGATMNCPAVKVTSNTSGYTTSCTATSGAGIATTASATIKRDATVPTVTPAVAGALGQNGWYTSNVNVSWTTAAAGPSGAGSTTGCAAATVSADTPGLAFTCAATSGAGVAANGTVTIERDATAPTITIGGNAGLYAVDATIAITCSAADATSGLASTDCAPISEPAYDFAAGAYSQPVHATDYAGNVATSAIAFTVALTPGAMDNLIARFVSGKSAKTLTDRMANIADKSAKHDGAALGSQVKNFLRELNDAVAAGDVTTTNAGILSKLVQQF